jgi:hypothetical protein
MVLFLWCRFLLALVCRPEYGRPLALLDKGTCNPSVYLDLKKRGSKKNGLGWDGGREMMNVEFGRMKNGLGRNDERRDERRF